MGRLNDARELSRRLGASLAELEGLFAARREADRDPLGALLEGDWTTPPPVARRVAPGRTSADRLARRTAMRLRQAAAPLALALSLATFAVVRLPSANTLWYEELTITSNVSTGTFDCEPPKLDFVSLSPDGRTLAYALSGDAEGSGPNCLRHDISTISVPMCFSPELKPKGRVEDTDEPPQWTYSPKKADLLAKWDWNGGANKGPWDPQASTFSITLDVAISASSMVDATARYKAWQYEVDLGTVKVPSCPLPDVPKALAPQQFAAPLAAPAEDDASEPIDEEPEVQATPLPTPAPVPSRTTAGPVRSGAAQNPSQPRPSKTPTPVGIAIWPGQ
jgi:hypothetical protein